MIQELLVIAVVVNSDPAHAGCLYCLCQLYKTALARSRGLRYGTYLDHTHRFHLAWDVDYPRETVNFHLTVRVGTDQWFGMGFSDYGESTNADVLVVWTNSRGTHFFQDAYTDSTGRLHIDRKQDYHLTDAWSRGHETELVFSRKFETCDGGYVFDNGTTHIIYFVGRGNPKSVSGVNVTSLHPGLQRVQLLKPDIPTPLLPRDTWTFDILAPKVRVPGKETTYWWYRTKLPPLRKKHHIIQFEGIIQKGNENLVHHMEVFHCEVGAKTRIPNFNGPGLGEGKPPRLESCRKVIGAWAMGAKALPYPDEAGSPIGGENYSRYVLLEVHYNNPGLKTGVIDQSGIRFYVTSSLRKYDAGIMELGLEYTNKMAIPPDQPHFHLTGYCVSDCTRVGLPRQGINIFASQLHTHLTGKKAYTKHVRHGQELPELNRDNHYSPHFQEIRLLPKPVRVLPGDALITSCVDNTIDRQNATIGGFAITDEMCVNYVHYYPAVELEVCKSSITTNALHSFFRFLNKWSEERTSPGHGDRENYQSIKWTPLNVHLLNSLYASAPLSMQCNMSSGRRFPGEWEGIPPTKITEPFWVPEEKC
ncbi:dopamine beta-hydroxylase-like [Liolophura sinensis]|uniref:dopamine beta-hydroxylase-like n=1 Tax=Liolophura sinensis TaxID=3198878 RepID=UPI0031590C18